MFIRIDIRLEGPICNCDKQNLVWVTSENGSLYIQCATCNVYLFIPHEKFLARFVLAKTYPGGIYIDEPDKLDDGTVVDTSDDFFKKFEDQINE